VVANDWLEVFTKCYNCCGPTNYNEGNMCPYCGDACMCSGCQRGIHDPLEAGVTLPIPFKDLGL
jgi:hypothetical protein